MLKSKFFGITLLVTAISQKERLLSITSPFGDDVLVATSCSGVESLNELFSFEIECFSLKQGLKPESILGKSVCLEIRYQASKHARPIHGLVNVFRVGESLLRDGQRYYLRIVPWFWLLTQTTDCRIYQNETSVSIAEKIFKQFGMRDYDTSGISGKMPTREYCVQYNESAFHFLCRLFEEDGISFYFIHEKNRHMLKLVNQKQGYTKTEAASLGFLHAKPTDSAVSGWQSEHVYIPGKYALKDYNFETPKDQLLSKSSSTVSLDKNSNFEIFHYPGLYRQNNDGNTLVKHIVDSYESAQKVVEGSSDCFDFFAGGLFDLSAEQPALAESGQYLLTSVTHRICDYSQIGGFLGEQQDQQYRNSFTCVKSNVALAPKYLTEKPRISGLQTATVVGPSGEEIYVDKYGRMKVQFHWDRYGENNEKSSCWVRVAQILAGKQWGAHFHPRVGDEVIVSFLEGDPDQPIIIGSLYNGINMPPYELPANKSRSGIKSHSTKSGGATDFNELRLEDKKGEEEFYLQAQKDLKTLVKNDETRQVDHDQSLTIKNNRSITVKEGDHTLVVEKGNRTATIKKGNETLTVEQGNRSVSVNMGNDSLAVKQGNRTVEIGMGNHEVTVKTGNQVVKVSLGSHKTSAMQSIELTVGQNSLKVDQMGVTIKGMMVKIQGQTMVDINGSALLQLKGGITMIN